MLQENLTPKYSNLTFKSQKAFEKWLKDTTKYEIELEDNGQDLIKFWVAENMEIIHAATGISAYLYNGTFITNGQPEELGMLKVYSPKLNKETYIKYSIEKVIINDNNS